MLTVAIAPKFKLMASVGRPYPTVSMADAASARRIQELLMKGADPAKKERQDERPDNTFRILADECIDWIDIDPCIGGKQGFLAAPSVTSASCAPLRTARPISGKKKLRTRGKVIGLCDFLIHTWSCVQALVPERFVQSYA
ncbi:MAG: hypothetical protein HYX38_00500 [Rhodospirillales bacterium]|nr:hypothetical protein [Rhodospirillales bacterium]